MQEYLRNKIIDWIEPKLREEDLYLVDVKCLPSNKIQVFMDSDQNVTIDHCARISRYLESYLDVEEGVPSNYNLEVSSPGIDRPLKIPRQYRKRIGRDLDIVTIDGKAFRAKLLSADEELIRLEKRSTSETSVVELPYSEIKKAVVQIDFNRK